MGAFFVTFSPGQAAEELWAFGEDRLADRALTISDDELVALWTTAARFYERSFPLPVEGRSITLGHVIAFAAMYHLENELRPLARSRRRPKATTPEHIRLSASQPTPSFKSVHGYDLPG